MNHRIVPSIGSRVPMFGRFLSQFFLMLLAVGALRAGTPADDRTDAPEPRSTVDVTVTVIDSLAETPLDLVRVSLIRGTTVVSVRATNVSGRAVFRDVQPGSYSLSAHYVGYTPYTLPIDVDSAHTDFRLALSDTHRDTLQITASRPSNVSTLIDVNTGVQTFEGETYHAPPSGQLTNLIQQNLAGAARAPTGEVHIRGQHGEYTYYLDGIPIPLGVFGGLNEVVDTKVIDRASFYTGGFPAEYGGQMAAVIDVETQIPAGGFHLDFSTYAGGYLTNRDSLTPSGGSLGAINSNGQSLSLSDRVGNLGFFLSGTRQETDRRIDQPTPQLFNDHGFDYFLFGKANYLLGENDYLAMNLNYSVTQTEVPYDPAEAILNDHQRTFNAFQTLSFFHSTSTGSDRETNFFAGVYAREGGLRYMPSLDDEPKTFLGEDTVNGYVIDENRMFTSYGFRTKFDQRLSHQFSYAAGLTFNNTVGSEEFNFLSPAGGPHSLTDFTGSDFGAFAQTEWHPLEWTRLDLGLRYDQHIAPDIPLQSQVSPRVKLNFFVDDANSFYLYYGRLFMPTNIEGLRSIAMEVGGDTASGTLPERDDFYEFSFQRNWEFGLTSKLAAFYKEATPGLDDETYGSSSIKSPVNINTVKTTGIELALTYSQLNSPFSAYMNMALIHAVGEGPVSGGFLPADSSTSAFDLDHDQRLSTVIGLNYQPQDWFVNLVAIYGSGLTNGNEDAAFKTGLFDFNQDAHTTPSWIFNLSGGYTFTLGGGQTLTPSLYITNLLDHDHLIKGAFFSGASFEERRNLVLKLAYHI